MLKTERIKILTDLTQHSPHPNIEHDELNGDRFWKVNSRKGGGKAIVCGETGKVIQWTYRNIVSKPANTRQIKRVDDFLHQQLRYYILDRQVAKPSTLGEQVTS